MEAIPSRLRLTTQVDSLSGCLAESLVRSPNRGRLVAMLKRGPHFRGFCWKGLILVPSLVPPFVVTSEATKGITLESQSILEQHLDSVSSDTGPSPCLLVSLLPSPSFATLPCGLTSSIPRYTKEIASVGSSKMLRATTPSRLRTVR